MEIKLYKIVDTDTLRHRETAQMILLPIVKEPRDTPVTLDFSGITFASRSFLHELLSGLNGRELKIINAKAEVKFMVKIAFNKPQLRLETSDEIKDLAPA
jgi:anti-anti-sigma regulatory factor